MIIAALILESSARARLHEALRGQAVVRFCERVSELTTLLENGLASIAVVDLRDADGQSTLATVRYAREQFPSIPVVLYCPITPETSRDVLDFARAGVNDLILRGVDDLRLTLRSAMATAQDHCAAAFVVEELTPIIAPSILPIMRFCLERGRRSMTVENMAEALSVHRKTLVDRLAAAGFPTPSALIAWCRLMMAARLLEDPGRTIEQVALILDFPSGTSLRNMMKRYVGLKTSEVRENGGLRCVLHSFKQALAPAARRAAS